MKKFFLTLLLVFLSLPALAAEESAYDRVVRTGTLRCGYGAWDPGVVKDPNTGAMRGLYVEMFEEAARLSKLKIEWAAEIDWGQIPEALQSGKIDAFCAGIAGDAARGKRMGYTIPVTYWVFDVIVRNDDTRFPADHATLADINKPEFSIAYTEGDVLETIKETELANVKGVPLPSLASPADNMMSVLSKKTDLMVTPKFMLQGYEKVNGGGKLRLVKMKTPLRVYGNVMAVDIHEQALINLLNAGLTELINSSSYDRILAPYETDYPGAFLPVQRNYVLEK